MRADGSNWRGHIPTFNRASLTSHEVDRRLVFWAGRAYTVSRRDLAGIGGDIVQGEGRGKGGLADGRGLEQWTKLCS